MGFSAVQIQVMPSSPNISLEELKQRITEKIGDLGGKVSGIEEQPVAFGLKSLIISLAWPEGKEQEELEEGLSQIENVSSAKVTDFRRAFG